MIKTALKCLSQVLFWGKLKVRKSAQETILESTFYDEVLEMYHQSRDNKHCLVDADNP